MDIKEDNMVIIKEEEDVEDIKFNFLNSPPPTPKPAGRARGSDVQNLFFEAKPNIKMSSKSSKSSSKSSSSSSSSGQACSFEQLAASYRIFMLEDLLAEPQELAYDPHRGHIYVSQRCLQGHAASPVEYSTYLSILDVSPDSPTQGTFIGSIDISPYGGPHGIDMDESGAYLHVDVDNDPQGGKGTITIELSTQAIVAYHPASGQQVAGASGSDFIAEVDLRKGKIQRKVTVPESEKRNNRGVGTGRHINVSTPGIKFSGKSSDKGSHVLDSSDPVVAILRSMLGSGSIYVLSKGVVLI